ncbi:MAG: flagellin lysine-N-methylase [Lachnospiraceae bacterium]|nr:flagellin lysine-N-methylase [Lachnospiraceae bacterium]
MKHIYPDYYETFVCIADKCPKSCCGGWQIEIDEDTLQRYKEMDLSCVDYENACFYTDPDKRCKNLDKSGLCRLILSYGEDILCDTCERFPRHIEEFRNVREHSLSISCPEVARILLSRREPVRLMETDDAQEDEESYDETEQAVYLHLAASRERFLSIAQNRTIPFEQRMDQILSIARAFQEEMDFVLLENADPSSLDLSRILKEKSQMPPLSVDLRHRIFLTMKEWEYTGREFEDILKETEEILYKRHRKDLFDALNDFTLYLSAQSVDWDVLSEQILVYFLYAYFCGSAYDEYYFGQAMLAVGAILHIQDLSLAFYLKTGAIHLSDIIRLTYLYARELEHSIPNVLATEAYMDAFL